MKKIRCCFVFLGLAVFAGAGLPAAQAAEASPVGAADGLSVVAWNVQWFPGRKNFAKGGEMREHADLVATELQKLDPDIFLAQEMRDWDSFARLCDQVSGLRAAAVSAFPSRRTGEYWRQQVAIASKLPVLAAWSEAWHASDQLKPPRGFTAAVVRLPGEGPVRHLLVYSLHFKSNLAENEEETKQNYRERDESARQLLAHMRDMTENVFQGSIVGIVAGGDFNTNQDGKFGDHVMKIMTDAGFHQTWAGVPADQRATWRGTDVHQAATFDHIFTKGLGRPRAELVDLPREVSDHAPVRIVIAEADLAKAQPLAPVE